MRGGEGEGREGAEKRERAEGEIDWKGKGVRRGAGRGPGSWDRRRRSLGPFRRPRGRRGRRRARQSRVGPWASDVGRRASGVGPRSSARVWLGLSWRRGSVHSRRLPSVPRLQGGNDLRSRPLRAPLTQEKGTFLLDPRKSTLSVFPKVRFPYLPTSLPEPPLPNQKQKIFIPN